MAEQLEPIEGNWYYDLENDLNFMVVSVDEDEELIELQYEDGETEEIEMDEWAELDLELSEEPEDWNVPDDEEEEEEDYEE